MRSFEGEKAWGRRDRGDFVTSHPTDEKHSLQTELEQPICGVACEASGRRWDDATHDESNRYHYL